MPPSSNLRSGPCNLPAWPSLWGVPQAEMSVWVWGHPEEAPTMDLCSLQSCPGPPLSCSPQGAGPALPEHCWGCVAVGCWRG